MMGFLKAFSAVAIAGVSAVAMAQAPAAPFVVYQVNANVYWVEGGGGNVVVIVGDKGVVLVDAKQTLAGGKELLADVAKITTKPVTTVILTHSDQDHVNGLVAFPAGIKIIAHENDKKELEAAIANGGPGVPPPADHLPTQLVTKNKEVLHIDGEILEVYHWAPAHTTGDLVVYLPKEKIVCTGDIVAAQLADPLIHLEKHGSSEGWITTAKGMVALDSDQFIPGHGDLQTKADVQKRLDNAIAKRAAINALVAQGKTLDEVNAAVHEPPLPVAVPGGRPVFPSYTTVVYQELTKK